MSIIWTNWRAALWGYRYGMPVVVLWGVGLELIVIDRLSAIRSAIHPDAGVTSLLEGGLYLVCLIGALFVLVNEVRVQEREMTAKPLTFCLPGYRQSMRRLSLTAALPWGVLFALVEAALAWKQGHLQRFENSEFFAACLCLGSTFLAGIAMGLAAQASRLSFFKLPWGILVLALTPLGILGVSVGMYVDIDATSFWIGTGAVSLIVIAFCWGRLGNMQCVARGHRAIIEEVMDKRAQVGVKRTAPAWTADLFLVWAERRRPLGLGRYVWASFYRTFGRVLSYWKWALVGAVALSVVLALAPRSVTEIAFAFLGFTAAFVDLTATSNLLLPGGRWERYCATLIAAIATSLLLLALALGIAGLSEMIAIGRGADAGSLGFRFRTAWLACVFVPWLAAGWLRGPILLGFENKVVAGVTGVLIMMAFELPLGIPFKWSAQTRLLFFASACLCGWAVFLLMLRHMCARGSLIEQKVRAGE